MTSSAASPDAVQVADAPWLSVLVPAYNVAPYVEAMLASVLAQVDPGVEVVVLDDASSDGTAIAIERAAERSGQVRLLRHAQNMGVAATRNRLLDVARGQYVWCVDADDVMRPGAIAGLAEVVRRAPVDLVTCDFRTVGGPPWLRRRRTTVARQSGGSDTERLVAGALRAGQLHIWSKVARRELWSDIRFPERRRFEDMTVAMRLLTRARDWRHVAEAWIGYRHRSESLSRDVPCTGLVEYAYALGEVRAIAASHVASPASRHDLDYYLLRGHASIARRLVRCAPRRDDEIATSCRARFQAHFPDRADAALEACRRRGWWLRAHRIERALAAAGWR